MYGRYGVPFHRHFNSHGPKLGFDRRAFVIPRIQSSHAMSSDSIAQETDALIRKLIALSIKDKRLVKSSIHHAPADQSIEVQSWKMNEFKYATYPSPFPTLARGLFTRYLPGGRGKNSESAEPNDQASTEDQEAGGRHVIVARGYDKFFNIGEVPWNTVREPVGRYSSCRLIIYSQSPRSGQLSRKIRLPPTILLLSRMVASSSSPLSPRISWL